MSYKWDWMLSNLISTGLADYYQINLCNNRNDVVLYKFGRAVGIMLTEIHIIRRTSNSFYNVTSFDFDCCYTKSFRSVIDLCNYIRDTYVPKEYRLLSTQERLKEKRRQRLERIKQEGRNSIGIVEGEFFNTYEKQCAYEEFHRRKYMNRREKK